MIKIKLFLPETSTLLLTGGSSPVSGILKVFHAGQWLVVCPVDNNTAQVVCRNLGFQFGASYVDYLTMNIIVS